MRINNIRFKHHKVLGDTSINLCGKKRNSSVGAKQNHDDMIIDLSNPSHNTFTFLIGDNGVGKSVLFKSIVDYSNAFSRVERNHKNLLKYYRLIGVYDGLRSYRGFDELFDDFEVLNIWNGKQFLENNNMYLVYVSSTINEGDLFGASDRYCEISFSSSNQTKIMLANAFRKNSKESRGLLSKYLNKVDSTWEQRLVISYLEWNDKDVMLTVKNGISLLSLLKLFYDLQLCNFDINNIDSDSLFVLRTFLSTISFKQYIQNCDLSVEEILNNINKSDLNAQLRSVVSLLISKEQILNHKCSSRAVGIRMVFEDGKTVSPILKDKLDIKELDEMDCLFVMILLEMGLLDFEISYGGAPVERMSSGEQMLIRLYALFANLPQNFEKRNLVMLYDEPEISLHPKWQQQFPEYFRIISEDIYNVTSSHFIFATHSPIIIMKSFFKKGDVNVVKLYREDNTTKSISIKDVHRYSIEELLMDDFSLEYRQPQQDLQLKEILDRENNRRIDDRSGCILGYDELRNEIERLYGNLTQKG